MKTTFILMTLSLSLIPSLDETCKISAEIFAACMFIGFMCYVCNWLTTGEIK